jgi:hypothetical protein
MLVTLPGRGIHIMEQDRRRRRRDYRREIEQREAAEAQPGDEQGAYPREELERMNDQFCRAIAAAARKGQ